MKLTFIFLLLLETAAFAQVPSKQGLIEYTIPDKGDTIHFYIYNPDTIKKTKVFLYLQGTGAYPMVNADENGQCCNNSFPKGLMKQFPADYAFVYIKKMGLPYYWANPKYTITQKFIDRNNVADRAEVANKVINYILKNIYPKTKIMAVLGHSEGTDVISKLVALNSKITHICYAAGSGYAHLYDEVQFIRRKMFNGEITATNAEAKLKMLYEGVDSVLADPNSTTKYFDGDTYKWWFEEINKPPIENLVKLTIPIFLVHGSSDTKVPVEGSDYIKAEFVRLKKNNLTYKVYLNCDHDFKEKLDSGEIKNHWNEMFFDFLEFVKKNSR